MLDEDKAQSKVDTQIRPRARRSTEEIPQLRTESSAMQMPAALQPGFQPALPSVPVPDSTIEAMELLNLQSFCCQILTQRHQVFPYQSPPEVVELLGGLRT